MAVDLTPATLIPEPLSHGSHTALLQQFPASYQRAMLPIIRPRVPESGIAAKRRALRARPFQLMERDREVLRAVYRYRALDRQQVQALLFPTMQKTCTRLQLLYQHGFVERLYRPSHLAHVRRGPVYRLGKRGAKIVADEHLTDLTHFDYWGKGDDRDGHQTEVGPVYLEHLVLLADIRIALERAATTAGCDVPLWRDEWDIRRAKQGDPIRFDATKNKKAVTIHLIPDGYFVLTTPAGQTGHFFLEADRGTESIMEKWRRKILSYKTLFSSGLFHERYGVGERATAFRVLVVTPSHARATHITAAAERYGDAGLARLFLATSIPDVVGNPLTTPIWHRGGIPEAQAIL